MTEMTMYWITRLDGINDLLTSLKIICGIIFVVSLIFWVIAASIRKANERYNRDDHVDSDWAQANAIANTVRPLAVWGLALSIAFSTAQVFVPTTREMAAIKVVPVVASPETCEKLKDISKDFVDVAAGWLKDVKENNKHARK